MAASRAALTLAALMILTSTLFAAIPACLAKEKVSRSKAPPSDPPMKVYVVTSAEEGCEPNCRQWIAAQGKIVAGSLAQFKSALGKIGKSNMPVLIHSGGGLAEEAMAIGRLIHKKGLDVAVAKT